MSAIAGIYNWDGQPISQRQLACMAAASRRAGPDRSGTTLVTASLALQAHLLHFDRLSTSERQPVVFDGGSVLTWDGRLDNREDLLMVLHRDLDDDRSDAALVALAYARWGLDALPRLLGDWSLACWDAHRRVLVLARDPMGNRPLHYAEVPNGVGWATCLDALLEGFDLYAEPDESYIAGKLTFGVPPDLTPFRRIRALRAGHVLTASAKGLSVRRYWTFAPNRLHYRDPHAYVDHLRALLRDAVRVRLRADRTVWAHLSGGWDSSSVVCIANALIREGSAAAPTLQPVTLTAGSSPESDDRDFVEAVERWCGLSSVRHEYGGYPLFGELLQHRRPFPVIRRLTMETSAMDRGDRIVLTGRFGDLVMGKTGVWRPAMLEPLHELKLVQFVRSCFSLTRRQRYPMAGALLHLAKAGYLPLEVQRKIEQRRRDASRASLMRISSRDLTKIYGVTPHLLAMAPQPPALHGPSVSDFPIAKRQLANMLYTMADNMAAFNAEDVGPLWWTSPYAHRPLVEFILAAPGLALWDPLVYRSGMRRALAYVLPPEILGRANKGDPNPALARGRRDRIADLEAHGLFTCPMHEWELVSRGYVDPASLSTALQDLRSNPVPAPFYLTICLHLEAWLRALQSRHDAVAESSSSSARDTLALTGAASTQPGRTSRPYGFNGIEVASVDCATSSQR